MRKKEDGIRALLGIIYLVMIPITYPYALESVEASMPPRTRGDWVSHRLLIVPVLSITWPIYWSIELGWGKGSEL